MKTKITYELVEDLSLEEIIKTMLDGGVFYNRNGNVSYSWNGNIFVNSDDELFYLGGVYYRRVETPIVWWEDPELRFPIALFNNATKYIVSFTKEEFENCRSLHNFRPATKADIKVLLDNALV